MQISDWLDEVLPRHERLTQTVKELLTNLLKQQNIDILEVSGRTKDKGSVIEKVRRKNYTDPKNALTDLTGIRVVTFFEHQTQSISRIIEETFDVDDENSMDRDKILGSDKVGYRSTHYVCNIGKQRGKLPEYKGLEDLFFEIQVRTVLQHAWAELEHDRSYKFSGELPGNLKRKLNLYAGMLEIVDNAFSEIALQIDEYSSGLNQESKDKILEEYVNSISLYEYMSKLEIDGIDLEEIDLTKHLIEEVRKFGIEKLSEFDKLLTTEVLDYIRKYDQKTTYAGFVRDILLLNDIDKYFNNIGKVEWSISDRRGFEMLCEKYGAKKVKKHFDKRGIDVEDEDETFLFEE